MKNQSKMKAKTKNKIRALKQKLADLENASTTNPKAAQAIWQERQDIREELRKLGV